MFAKRGKKRLGLSPGRFLLPGSSTIRRHHAAEPGTIPAMSDHVGEGLGPGGRILAREPTLHLVLLALLARHFTLSFLEARP
jgi:hypothetical protein